MAVQGAMPAWFRLNRHDGEGATPAADTAPATGATDPEDAQAEALLADAVASLEDPGKKALQQERAARKAAENAVAERDAKLKAYEDRDKTEAEKLAEKAEAAEKRAEAAAARAVKAEVKALADKFEDKEDAVLNLGDLSRFVTDGDVGTDAIEAALEDVLKRKPHLAKADGPRTPRADPGQGGRPPVNTDFTKADHKDFAAEARKYGIRPRSFS